VVGQAVSFKVALGGGSAFAGMAVSDANGIATERWTLGRAVGPQQLKARAVSSATGVATLAVFDAIALAGPPVAISVSAGLGQTGPAGTPLPAPIKVHVTDKFGNAVADTTVELVPGSGFGLADPVTASTDAAGDASSIWTLGPSLGVQSLEVRCAGVHPATVTATTPVVSEGARLILVSGGGQIAPVGTLLPLPVVVELQDQYGIPVSGQTVTYSTQSGGIVTPTSTLTGSDGRASVEWELPGVAGETTLLVHAVDPATGRWVPDLVVLAQVQDPLVAAPIFEPVAGSYAGTQSITISSLTPGAVIYYTTDGSTPSAASTQYTTPVTVAWEQTVKAIATKPAGSASAVASATYVIDGGFLIPDDVNTVAHVFWRRGANNFFGAGDSPCSDGNIANGAHWSAYQATCVDDGTTGPDGTLVDQITKSLATGSFYKAGVTIPSNRQVTTSVWAKHPTTTGYAGVSASCAATPQACTCTTDDAA
jgi:hypothetical protein